MAIPQNPCPTQKAGLSRNGVIDEHNTHVGRSGQAILPCPIVFVIDVFLCAACQASNTKFFGQTPNIILAETPGVNNETILKSRNL
jgi:hypothetical protein